MSVERGYLIGAVLYAIYMLGWALGKGSTKTLGQELFSTGLAAVLWPICLPIDAMAFVLRRMRDKQ